MKTKLEKLINYTTGLCTTCKASIDAVIFQNDHNEVIMRKECKLHGEENVRLSTNAEWYIKTRNIKAPHNKPAKAHEIKDGCPFDCGPCSAHTQKVRLPVVNITSACNLNCPICFVHNKNKEPYHMSESEFKAILDHLTSAHKGELDLINFTGGDPTLHPQYTRFIELSQQAGIHRVSICTNGIKFVQDEEHLKKLSELGARVALSFDSFENEADVKMQGTPLLHTKLKCLELLKKYNINTTLIPVITKGYNDHEVGKIIELLFTYPNIRHLEFHTMTYTGPNGVSFDRNGRISIYEVLERIESQTSSLLKINDFVSSPCAHSLCYQIAYFLVPESGTPIPFTKFLSKEILYNCLADRLYLEPSAKLENAMRNAINDLWIKDDAEAQLILKTLKDFMAEMFPKKRALSQPESLAVSEKFIKAIYIHSHMDEETFDTERIAECCDSDCFADGTTIPVCAYNVLYRERDKNFNQHPVEKPMKNGRINFKKVKE
jgi:7,8-dihydro-6-hydroxymethylpterin dimethyltransferase